MEAAPNHDAAPRNVLFLCTANSARSIMAEVIMNSMGQGRFRGFSAGSFPGGIVNPHAVDLLRKNGLPTDGLRSKSWDEFATLDAPIMDFIITVCDDAAGEVCPVWPGHPVTAHWGVPDPAATVGDPEAKRRSFVNAFTTLQRRIELFLSLPLAKLDATAVKGHLHEIGKS